MDNRNNQYNDPWDEGMYGIGNTMPPKNHSGIIALLLILVIFLSGVVSVLSFLNIRLFQQLSRQQSSHEPEYPLFVASSGPTEADSRNPGPDPTEPDHGQVSIILNQSPQSQDNIPEPGAEAIQDIYTRACQSMAGIESSTTTGTLRGSAVALSEMGYLLTPWSVVEDAETISVLLPDGSTHSALIVGADPVTDLAVLYAEGVSLIPAQFGDSSVLRVGDSVYALGSTPDSGPGSTLSPGMISGVHRDILISGQALGLIRSTAPMPGDSTGAPLINCYGQVVGIHTGNASSFLPDAQTEGMQFALDSATVRDIVNQLITLGYVSGRPTLGIRGEDVSRFDQYYFHIPPGLYIREVDPFSDAWTQGIEPGDILISVNGHPITSQSQLDALVISHQIGDSVQVTLLRNSKEQTLTLVLTEYTG